jgi:hypothetical protein
MIAAPETMNWLVSKEHLKHFPTESFLAGGKSAILTAICVTFGASAKNTQRASSAKDFIKNGEQ